MEVFPMESSDERLYPVQNREQVYDETFKQLERKDHRAMAEFLFPDSKQAESITLESTTLPMSDFRDADFITRVTMGEDEFLCDGTDDDGLHL